MSHIRRHTCSSYFCILSSSCPLFISPLDLLQHFRTYHFKEDFDYNKEDVEQYITDMVLYQQQLNESMSFEPRRLPEISQTLFKGCNMCDKIIEIFSINDDDKIRIKKPATNLRAHLAGHLQYKPLQCKLCSNSDTNNHIIYTGHTYRSSEKPRMKQHMLRVHKEIVETWDNKEKDTYLLLSIKRSDLIEIKDFIEDKIQALKERINLTKNVTTHFEFENELDSIEILPDDDNPGPSNARVITIQKRGKTQ